MAAPSPGARHTWAKGCPANLSNHTTERGKPNTEKLSLFLSVIFVHACGLYGKLYMLVIARMS